MKREVSNAFTRASSGFRSPSRSLASSLASMRVQVERSGKRCRVELSPMSAFDGIAASTLIEGESLAEPVTILLNVTVRDDLTGASIPIESVAARWGIDIVALDAGTRRPGAPRLLVGDGALRQLLALVDVEAVTALRVEGPLDPIDAAALADAVVAGADPLDDERVLAAFEVEDDRTVHLVANDFDAAMTLVGENFRHYLAALSDEPPATFSGVPADVLGVWLRDGGAMTIRPIETELYSTFIDVGVCLTAEPSCGPARAALIYDHPSATWHGES